VSVSSLECVYIALSPSCCAIYCIIVLLFGLLHTIMKDISLSVQNQVFALHKHTTLTYRDIGSKYGIYHNVVYGIIKIWRTTGSVASSRTGKCDRKLLPSERDKTFILRTVHQHPSSSVRELWMHLGEVGHRVCDSVIQKIIKKSGFNTSRPLGIPNLTAERMKVHLEWARIHDF
jgi:transposase